MLESSRAAEPLVVYQEGLNSMDLYFLMRTRIMCLTNCLLLRLHYV
jgi:hypothetical protein